ncbi:MAG: hypothetical protein KatS3mg008_0115 [Acidimicrobiales bacterium]|nr:MAG: hypothetical protein KatS3mg008_0115 [Acidimicrobiales bacterium]
MSGTGLPAERASDASVREVDRVASTLREGAESPVEDTERAKTLREGLPIRMLHDRVLVSIEEQEGERLSAGGILIPATAKTPRRLVWARVVAVGPSVRHMQPGDRVLFNPEDRLEVEVRGRDYVILRERDVHAVAAERLEEGSTGLYL